MGRLLPRLRSVLESIGGRAEIVVVLPADEPVADLVERFGARVEEFKGGGYGVALNAGLAAARGRWVVTMDADFSHHPEFIRTLWLRRREADLLIASRYVPGQGQGLAGTDGRVTREEELLRLSGRNSG